MSDVNRDNFLQTINTRKATPSEVAYRNGYAHGRNLERQSQSASLSARDRNNIRDRNNVYMYRNAYRNNVSDVLLGILLASVVGVIVATFFIMTRENRPTSVETTSPELIQPNVSQPQSVQRETTVIERTVDRVREVIPTTPQSVEIVVPSTPASPAPSPVISDQPTSQQVNEQTESQTGAIDEVPLPNTSSPDAMAQ